jgi:hypothetical protein
VPPFVPAPVFVPPPLLLLDVELELHAPSTSATALAISSDPASGLTRLFMGLLHRNQWPHRMSIVRRDRI